MSWVSVVVVEVWSGHWDFPRNPFPEFLVFGGFSLEVIRENYLYTVRVLYLIREVCEGEKEGGGGRRRGGAHGWWVFFLPCGITGRSVCVFVCVCVRMVGTYVCAVYQILQMNRQMLETDLRILWSSKDFF